MGTREAEEESTPPRPWRFYFRGVYLGCVRGILAEADIRQMFPHASIWADTQTVDVSTAEAERTRDPRDPRD